MNSVVKGCGYVLAHVPDMVVHNGTTQTAERAANPASEFLARLPGQLRGYAQALGYPPNQVYIGNITPEALAQMGDSWLACGVEDAKRHGPFGELLPQAEFYLLMRLCDTFDLVRLERGFMAEAAGALAWGAPLCGLLPGAPPEGVDASELASLLAEGAEGLYMGGALVGCVKKAHDLDENLSAHVMLENLASKASSVAALLYAVRNSGLAAADIEYVIDCGEEAVGDMNQRGGGNLAKAAAEAAGLANASGSDTRAFCAGPAHAIVNAAALVEAGVYGAVAVTAGGATAKLGMNARDHVKKDLPVLEDLLGGFAVIITKNDGVSPEINLGILGRHTVGTGSSPQAVLSALVSEPLKRAGLRISDVDKYAPELQNPDITRPAGAGDVPLANYKMIGALAVVSGEIDKKDLPGFIARHGMPGWAPTQGHIPSGVPYIGHACGALRQGHIRRAMVIGKGSLFLGRMTGQFDGVSFVLQQNSAEEGGAETRRPQPAAVAARAEKPRVVLTGMDSEHGEQALLEGALAARGEARVCYIGALARPGLDCLPAKDPAEARRLMEELLESGEADAGITMHHPFPIGVTTVGRVVTPAMGREMFIAATTGCSAAERREALVRNAVAGLAVARACGVEQPTLGLLNVEGAHGARQALARLEAQGYPLRFAATARSGGDTLMRGNDVLQGTADVLVCDALTGNVIMKMLSAYATGGGYEATGCGYGPGVGPGVDRPVLILSRASGAPVVAGAIRYAAALVRGGFGAAAEAEYARARAAGLDALFEPASPNRACPQRAAPPPEPVTHEIAGVEVMDLETGVAVLAAAGIYAQSGMGCTGPVILVPGRLAAPAEETLRGAGFLA